MKKLILFTALLFSVLLIYGQRDVQGDRVIAHDSIYINGEWIYINSGVDDQIIKRVNGRWINTTLEHNKLTGLDGGEAGYYGHLTNVEKLRVSNFQDSVKANVPLGNVGEVAHMNSAGTAITYSSLFKYDNALSILEVLKIQPNGIYNPDGNQVAFMASATTPAFGISNVLHFAPLSSDPAVGAIGYMWFNDPLDKWRGYDGVSVKSFLMEGDVDTIPLGNAGEVAHMNATGTAITYTSIYKWNNALSRLEIPSIYFDYLYNSSGDLVASLPSGTLPTLNIANTLSFTGRSASVTAPGHVYLDSDINRWRGDNGVDGVKTFLMEGDASSSSGDEGALQWSDGTGGFSADAQELYWSTANERLGINGDQPLYDLHVFGDMGAAGIVYDSNGDAGLNGEVFNSTVTGTDWDSITQPQIVGLGDTLGTKADTADFEYVEFEYVELSSVGLEARIVESGDITIASTDYTIIYNGTSAVDILMPASPTAGKIYILVNRSPSNDISLRNSDDTADVNYFNIAGTTTDISSQTSVHLQYVGTAWYQIN